MTNDLESEREAPYSLMALCGHGSHTHICSDLIRFHDEHGPLTCLECVRRWFSPHEILFVADRDAPCWDRFPVPCN